MTDNTNDIDRLQKVIPEVKEWTERNFPLSVIYDPAVGLLEEVGELSHAILKRYQGIRTNEDHIADGIDAVGDCTVYILHMVSLSDSFDWAKLKSYYEDMQPKGKERSVNHPYRGSLALAFDERGMDPGIGLALQSGIETGRLLHNINIYGKCVFNGAGTIRQLAYVLTVLDMIAKQFDSLMIDCLEVTWKQVKKRDWIKTNQLAFDI